MSRSKGLDGPDGFLVVDKEAGWTSHDVVARLRRVLGQRRTGHAGTLDPSATGVLVVGVGRSTRLMRFVQNTTKRYEGVLVLGSTTSTLDADGEVTGTFEMGSVTADEVEKAASALTGDLLQIPPMVSAVKVGGRRLHEMAREGIEVERAARPVHVERFEVASTDDPSRYTFNVVCSSGTFVRSLIDDLGRSLGGGAHMETLRRSGVGHFGLEDARTMAQIEEQVAKSPDGPQTILLRPADALRNLERLEAGEEAAFQISTGRALDSGELGAQGPGPFAIVRDGTLLAVYDRGEGDALVASVVLSAR